MSGVFGSTPHSIITTQHIHACIPAIGPVCLGGLDTPVHLCNEWAAAHESAVILLQLTKAPPGCVLVYLLTLLARAAAKRVHVCAHWRCMKGPSSVQKPRPPAMRSGLQATA